jgi:hypothetical protein
MAILSPKCTLKGSIDHHGPVLRPAAQCVQLRWRGLLQLWTSTKSPSTVGCNLSASLYKLRVVAKGTGEFGIIQACGISEFEYSTLHIKIGHPILRSAFSSPQTPSRIAQAAPSRSCLSVSSTTTLTGRPCRPSTLRPSRGRRRRDAVVTAAANGAATAAAGLGQGAEAPEGLDRPGRQDGRSTGAMGTGATAAMRPAMGWKSWVLNVANVILMDGCVSEMLFWCVSQCEWEIVGCRIGHGV